MSVVSLGSLLYNLPVDRRKSVRDLEKLSTKISKLQCSLLFNNTCLREGILPTYSNGYFLHFFSVKCSNSRVSLPILSNFCNFLGKKSKKNFLSHTIFDFLLENFFDQVTSKIYVKILQKHDKNMPKKTQTRGTPHLNDPSTHGYLLQFFADA